MAKGLHIRPGNRGCFDLFRGETCLLMGMTRVEAYDFCCEYLQDEALAESYFAPPASGHHLDPVGHRKRPIGPHPILAEHIGLMRDMVARNPRTTAKDIESVLRTLGVKFSTTSVVRSVARRYKLDLAA